MSGGTDFAGAFVGGNRELPLIPGEMQCRMLGCAVEALNEQGRPVVDEVGELVCLEPLPSMPLYFWGDADKKRYLSSYFDMYPANFDGSGRGPAWRHGDWLKVTPNGGCIIYGRSDATINRHGLRMGTSELYSAVEALPEVLDSMVVDLEYLGRESYMPLFVVLREGLKLDEAIKAKINSAIRTALSPRFVPNGIFQVAEIPRTLSGKKQELPIKKLLLGQPIEKVINRDAMANPGCLDWYVAFAMRGFVTRAEGVVGDGFAAAGRLRSVTSASSTVSAMKTAARQNTPRGIDWSMIQPNSSGEMMPLMLKPVETMPKARPAAPGGADLRTSMSREGAITPPRKPATVIMAISSTGCGVSKAISTMMTTLMAKQAAATSPCRCVRSARIAAGENADGAGAEIGGQRDVGGGEQQAIAVHQRADAEAC